MRVLVTGATGFIGSHLCKALADKGHEVIALVRDVRPSRWLREALRSCVKVRGDVTDYFSILRPINHYEVDAVAHLAAMSIVKTAYKDPINCFRTNVMGTIHVLEACRQIGVEKVLIQSTDKVFGNQIGATKDSRLIPTEPYGTSKICTDVAAQCFMNTYGMNIVITRCCNVYGFDPFNNRIVPNTVKACLRGESPIIYKGDTSSRQYIYIDDVVNSMICLIENDVKGIFNIASHYVRNQEEVVLEILRHFPGLKPKYVEKPRLKEIHHQSMVPDLPEKCTSFSEGIRLTIEKFKEYRGDWDRESFGCDSNFAGGTTD